MARTGVRVSEPKMKEIADRINAHLKRFEADPGINVPKESRIGSGMGTRPFFSAFAYVAGPRVAVQYISYQPTSKITKTDALRYLAWLDAGNVGRHYEALKADS